MDRRRCRRVPRRSCRARRARCPRPWRRAARTMPRAGRSRRCGRDKRALGEFLAGDAPDEPGVAVELVVQSFKHVAAGPLGAPAAVQRTAVDAGGHVADGVGFHRCLPRARLTSQNASSPLSLRPVPAAARQTPRRRRFRPGAPADGSQAPAPSARGAQQLGIAMRRPTSCSPTGSPSFVSPQGSESAGQPVRVMTKVRNIQSM